MVKSTGLNHTAIQVEKRNGETIISLLISLPASDREVLLDVMPDTMGVKRVFYIALKKHQKRIEREDATASAIWEDYIALMEDDRIAEELYFGTEPEISENYSDEINVKSLADLGIKVIQ